MNLWHSASPGEGLGKGLGEGLPLLISITTSCMIIVAIIIMVTITVTITITISIIITSIISSIVEMIITSMSITVNYHDHCWVRRQLNLRPGQCARLLSWRPTGPEETISVIEVAILLHIIHNINNRIITTISSND